MTPDDWIGVMNATYLLDQLRQRGYTLTAQDGKLMVSPASKLNEGERAEIRDHKTALLTLLTIPSCPWKE